MEIKSPGIRLSVKDNFGRNRLWSRIVSGGQKQAQIKLLMSRSVAGGFRLLVIKTLAEAWWEALGVGLIQGYLVGNRGYLVAAG